MGLFNVLRGRRGAHEKMIQALSELVAGIGNQSELLNHKFEQLLEAQGNQNDQISRKFDGVVAGIDNQSDLLNRKLEQLIGGQDHQSDLLNRKLEEVAAGGGSQSDLLNRKLEGLTAGVDNQTDLLNRKLEGLTAGVDNQTDLLNRKFEQLTEGQDHQTDLLKQKQDHQTDLLSQKFEQLIKGQDHQTDLLNRKFQQLFVSEDNQTDLLNRKSDDLLGGIDNQTDLLNRKFEQLFVSLDDQTDLLNRKFEQLLASEDNQSSLIDRRFGQLISALSGSPPSHGSTQTPRNFAEAMQHMPLMIDERTFNTCHPDYDAKLVRNYPSKIFNRNGVCTNSVFGKLLKQAEGDEVADGSWNAILADALIEAASVPGAAQVFERRNFIENYMAELGRKYHAVYVAGWVNLDDALFLYWLVRQTKPRTIVQCGACNGLSSSFMMLALAKNGPEGTLSIIDLPFVFDPKDPKWTEEGKAHGVCIPEGKTTAWIVPDIYRDRLEVWNGDAKDLLPKMIDKVDSIDFFFHDSDHTYRHMMFEFAEAKRKLTPGGLIVADDISWNSSLWDFADSYGAPSYNFKGTVGTAFF